MTNLIMDEKRNQRRNSVRARLRISHTKIGQIEGWSRNITDKGLFAELLEIPKLPIGAHIRLQLLDSVSPELTFNTRVVRVERDGLALVWVDYEQDGQRFPATNLQQHMRELARSKTKRKTN